MCHLESLPAIRGDTVKALILVEAIAKEGLDNAHANERVSTASHESTSEEIIFVAK